MMHHFMTYHYNNKYISFHFSIRHEIKLRSDYACTTLPSAQYFPAKTAAYDVTMDISMTHAHHVTDIQPLVQISDKTLSSVKNPGEMTLMQNIPSSSVPRGVRTDRN